MAIIRHFSDGTLLEFGRGRFDEWCVLLTNVRVKKHALKDIEYFQKLKSLASSYKSNDIYDDFVQVYDRTGKTLDTTVLHLISTLSEKYQATQLEIELLLSILYATMIAEENKQKAILKKRIKRLAVHQILVEGLEPTVVASFSKGKRWYDLDAECRKRGF